MQPAALMERGPVWGSHFLHTKRSVQLDVAVSLAHCSTESAKSCVIFPTLHDDDVVWARQLLSAM